MVLVILTALLAVCGAAKLDQSYLPPITAKIAGGSPGALEVPLVGAGPSGSYINDVQGVVVDAVNPGTRTSGDEPTGLGGPRASYGSINSKVGEAAFHSDVESSGPGIASRIAPGFDDLTVPGGSQADVTRAHTLKFANDVGLDNYSYQYETDNGISVGENGVAVDGVQAQGGYSYKGNDGKTYSVSYTADEGGYRPQGQHLPTPPPIPVEILESLEKNAKEEAAGLVDDGSYDAQKYNEEGDYSSNGAGNNNDKPTIGGGDATASGSFVTSNDAQRPTSGVLIGSYKPTATSQTVQENTQEFVQISANEQSSSNLIKEHRESQGSGVFKSPEEQGNAPSQFGSESQFGAKPQGSTSYTHSTQTKFGVQGSKFDGAGSSKPQAQTQASASSGPVFIPNIQSAPKDISAYSSAVATGSGSASAFASTGPTDYDYKNYYTTVNNFGSAGQLNQGSKLSSVDTSAPSTASAFASASKTPPIFSSQYPQNSGVKPPKADFPSSASVTGNQASQFGQNANSFPSRFGDNQSGNVVTSSQYVPSVNIIESTYKPSPSAASAFSSSNSGISSQKTDFQSQYSTVQPTQPSQGIASIASSKPNEPVTTDSIFNYQTSNQALNSFTQTGPTDGFASSTQKPALSVGQQAYDNSYTYEKPSKPFVTISAIPSSSSSSQVSNNRQPNFPISSLTQQGSKYVNTPSISTTGQYQGSTSSSYNGVTQATISSFPSSLSSSSQFGSKPSSSLFGQSSISSQDTSTRFGQQNQPSSEKPDATFGQKPIVQSQTQFGQQLSSGQNLVGSQVSNQQYQGTVYEYNKPAQTLPAPENKGTSSSFAQATSGQTVSQTKPNQVSTDSRFGSQQESAQTKPFGSNISQGSNFQQIQTTQGSTLGSQTNLFAQKPSIPASTTSQKSQFDQKPFISSQKSGSNYQQTQIGFSGSQLGQKPQISQISQNKQTEFGSTFNAKPVSTQTTSSVSRIDAQSQSFSQKPVGSSQTTGSTFQQTQFGSTGSQLGQKLQSTQSTSQTSTASQTSFVQKPIVTTQTNSYYQQGQSSGSKLGNTPLLTQGTSSTVTSSQTTFGQKPFGTSQTGSTYQQTLGSTTATSQSGQKPFGSSQNIGSSLQQNQIGSSAISQSTSGIAPLSQFGQASQFGQKPFGSSQTGSIYQQTQFGATTSQSGKKPQTTQGSSFVSTTGSKDQTVQTTQSALKPFGASQTAGSNLQQNRFGSSATSQSTSGGIPQSQFGQVSQFGQKPFGSSQTGSTYQQTLGSNTVTSQSGQKPFGSSQNIGSSSQQNQIGSSVISQSTSSIAPQNQFGQASLFGQKPFGSSQTGSTYQQTQFGATTSQFGKKPQTTQGTSFVSTTGSKDQTVQTTQFGQKPFGSSQTAGSSFQQNQFGSSAGSQLTSGVTPQTQLGQVSQVIQKPFGSSQTGSTNQQTQFGSTKPQFNQKPQTTQGTSFVSTTGSKDQTVQITQFGQKPSGSSQIAGPVFQENRFGTTTSSQSTSGVASQSQFGQKPVGSSQTISSSFQPTQFGSSYSQTGQKPQPIQGAGLTSSSSQTSFGRKPTVTAQTNSYYQQGQSTISKFGNKPLSTQGTGSIVTSSQTTFSQKPLGTSQTGSSYQQSQFGQKPQTTQGTSFGSTIGSKEQTVQTSQFGQKPFSSFQTSGSSFQQNQFGSSSSSQSALGVAPQGQFGQASQFGQKPSGSSQTGPTYQQTQFGSTTSQSGKKPETTQSTSFVSTTSSKDQTVQTSQFGPKPFGSSQTTGSSFQQNQFGSSASSQSTSGVASQSQLGQVSQFGQKPFGSSQIGSAYQQTQFGSTTSQFGQKPQTVQGTSFVSTTGSKDQSLLTTQFGQKPFSSSQTAGSIIQENRFGSTTSSQQTSGVSPQSQFGQVSQFGQNPVSSTQTGSTYQQAQFGPNKSQLSQKPQTTQGTLSISTDSKDQTVQTTQFGQKPFGSSQTAGSSYQQNQFSSSGSSQLTSGVALQNTGGQASQSGQKPFGSSQSGYYYQQSKFGSTGSQLGQKPQTTQVSTQQPLSVSQFVSTESHAGQKPQSQGSSFTTTTGSTGQFGQIAQSAQKPFGSAGSSLQQAQSASKFNQQSQQNVPTFTTVSQTVTESNLSGQKPIVGSQASNSNFQLGAFGSQFAKKPASTTFGSYNQASQLGTQVKPSGTTETQFGSTSSQSQANAFASSSSSNVDQFESQTRKPFSGSVVQTNNQQSQYTPTPAIPSRLGEASQSNVGNGFPASSAFLQSFYQNQAAIKPVGSSQYTQSNVQAASPSSQSSQGTFGSTQSGYNYQKPDPVFTLVSSQTGGQVNSQNQKTNPADASYTLQISNLEQQFSIPPIDSSSNQGPYQQNIVTSNRFSSQPARPQFSTAAITQGPAISNTEYTVQSNRPTSSNQYNSFGSQNSVVSTSQFQPTQNIVVTPQRPSQSVQTLNPTSFASAQASSFPSRLGYNVNVADLPAVSTAQSSVVTSQGTKVIGGEGEQFGGPRDPPKFDDKTGYHY